MRLVAGGGGRIVVWVRPRIDIARKNKLPSIVINKKKYEKKLEFEKKLIDETKKFEPKLIILAGFLHILSKKFLKYFLFYLCTNQ